MAICLHRWSNVKRWLNSKSGLYHVIQRCRRCDAWQRKTFDLKTDKLEFLTGQFKERKLNSGIVEDGDTVNSVKGDGEKGISRDIEATGKEIELTSQLNIENSNSQGITELNTDNTVDLGI